MPGLSIFNSEEEVEEIVNKINMGVQHFGLEATGEQACQNVNADERCDATYETGIRQTEELKVHILNTNEFIVKVNGILMDADKEAAKSNELRWLQ